MIAKYHWSVALSLVVMLSARAVASEGDWPCWRGPFCDGHTTESSVPVQWDGKSIVWRTELPGEGQSSPVIAGDRIFLTAALESGRQRVVLCVDRRNGKIIWQETVWTGTPEKTHTMNGWASATCATDGERVVAFFGRGGLHCFDVAGKKLWSKDLGTFEGPWGTGASPLIVDNLVIQNCIFSNGFYMSGYNNSVFNNCVFDDTPSPGVIGANNIFNATANNLYNGFPTQGTNSNDARFALKTGSPAIGAGIGGTDCGVFGGVNPYKLSGIPAVPAFYKLTAPGTSASTNPYTITFSVKGNN